MSQNNTTLKKAADQVTISSSVESLISQNDDLMARLAVSIRKEAKLEHSLKESAHETGEIERKMESYADQILIYREKDQIQTKRNQQVQEQVQLLTKELDVLKIKNTEIFTTSNSKINETTSDRDRFFNTASRLKRFKDLMNRKFYPEYREQKKTITQFKSSLTDLHRHLGESAEHIKSLQTKYNDLKNNNQNTISQMTEKIKNAELYKSQYTEIKESRAAQQNKIIALERFCSEVQSKHHEEISSLQETLSTHRLEKKSLLSENQMIKTQSQEIEEYRKNLLLDNDKLRDYNESLLVLWKENKEQLDTNQDQLTSITKLNEELLNQMTKLRKENTQLRELSTSETIVNQVAPGQLTPNIDLRKRPINNQKNAIFEKRSIHDLEILLAEIQSGHMAKKSLFTANVNEETFIEENDSVNLKNDQQTKALDLHDSQLLSEDGDLSL